jgi:hypothetical protein
MAVGGTACLAEDHAHATKYGHHVMKLAVAFGYICKILDPVSKFRG